MNRLFILGLVVLIMASCGEQKTSETNETSELNLYTHRHYDTDKEIFKAFEEKTGITVNVIKASADELIQKMEEEGNQSPADVLITVDAGRLVRANQKGLLQPVESQILENTVPANLRAEDNTWFALTKRARVIVYDKDKVKPADLSTYEALTDKKWNGKLLIRSSSNIYNQSLMASIIANNGEEAAKKWAEGIVANLGRDPQGNDRDQVKGIVAGDGQIAVVNTYYLGKLLNSEDAAEVKAGNAVKVFFPNQENRGTHINVSGAGVAKYAPNKENAIKFLEYLVSKDVQGKFSSANYEYPVNAAASISELLQSWGEFKEDKLPLSKLGELNKDAVKTFDAASWK